MAKKKAKQTLKEFKAWIQGIEELQPDNWAPNREQWKLIRERIDNIIEEKPKIVEKQSSNVKQEQNRPQVPPAPPIIAPPVPASIPPVNNAGGGLPIVEEDGKLKTPNIDTSDGKYESPFV